MYNESQTAALRIRVIESCYLMGNYHFWFKYDYPQAMKYMDEGKQLIKSIPKQFNDVYLNFLIMKVLEMQTSEFQTMYIKVHKQLILSEIVADKNHMEKCQEFNGLLWEYVKSLVCYMIMRNLLKKKYCHYIQCLRIDVLKWNVCERCKSAFYCCRNHQKKHWNRGDHKENCVYNDNRHILSPRFKIFL